MFRQQGRLVLTVAVTVVLMLTLAGCVKKEPPKQGDGGTAQKSGQEKPAQQPGGEQTKPQPPAEKLTLTLYFGNKDATGVVAEKREVVKTAKPVEEVIIEELIKGSQKGLYKTIPPEAKLRSIKVEDGLATVDFSREVQTKHWGGTAGEAMTIDSVVNSLTELEYIKKVQFLVEGKKEEAIWGHADTTGNFERIPQVITTE